MNLYCCVFWTYLDVTLTLFLSRRRSWRKLFWWYLQTNRIWTRQWHPQRWPMHLGFLPSKTENGRSLRSQLWKAKAWTRRWNGELNVKSMQSETAEMFWKAYQKAKHTFSHFLCSSWRRVAPRFICSVYSRLNCICFVFIGWWILWRVGSKRSLPYCTYSWPLTCLFEALWLTPPHWTSDCTPPPLPTHLKPWPSPPNTGRLLSLGLRNEDYSDWETHTIPHPSKCWRPGKSCLILEMDG